jgi:hypothetical protein
MGSMRSIVDNITVTEIVNNRGRVVIDPIPAAYPDALRALISEYRAHPTARGADIVINYAVDHMPAPHISPYVIIAWGWR